MLIQNRCINPDESLHYHRTQSLILMIKNNTGIQLGNQMGTNYPLIAALLGLNQRLCANSTEAIGGGYLNLLCLKREVVNLLINSFFKNQAQGGYRESNELCILRFFR